MVCNCSDEFEQVDGGRLINMRNLFSTMFCFSFNAMYLGRNNGNISETKKRFLSQRFLKIRKVLLDMRKGFLIMSNFYLVEIRRESNNIAIVRS